MDSSTETETTIATDLVISGGFVYGLAFFGALRELHALGAWCTAELRAVYGTSAGACIAVALALGLEMDVVETYLVERPWHDLFGSDAADAAAAAIACVAGRGAFGIDVFDRAFEPLFAARDLSLATTMREFFKETGVDLHVVVTQLATCEAVDVSHTTHPDWRVVDAVYASCALPLVFEPFISPVDGQWYLDGGVAANYPSAFCGAPDRAIGVRLAVDAAPLAPDAALAEYVGAIFSGLVRKNDVLAPALAREVRVPARVMGVQDIARVARSREARAELVAMGREAATGSAPSSSP
jgi:predicted acylesterase/phospholipase RssA